MELQGETSLFVGEDFAAVDEQLLNTDLSQHEPASTLFNAGVERVVASLPALGDKAFESVPLKLLNDIRGVRTSYFHDNNSEYYTGDQISQLEFWKHFDLVLQNTRVARLLPYHPSRVAVTTRPNLVETSHRSLENLVSATRERATNGQEKPRDIVIRDVGRRGLLAASSAALAFSVNQTFHNVPAAVSSMVVTGGLYAANEMKIRKDAEQNFSTLWQETVQALRDTLSTGKKVYATPRYDVLDTYREEDRSESPENKLLVAIFDKKQRSSTDSAHQPHLLDEDVVVSRTIKRLVESIKYSAVFKTNPDARMELVNLLHRYVPTTSAIDGKLSGILNLYSSRDHYDKQGKIVVDKQIYALYNEIRQDAQIYKSLVSDLEILDAKVETPKRLKKIYSTIEKLTRSKKTENTSKHAQNTAELRAITLSYIEAYLRDIPQAPGFITDDNVRDVKNAMHAFRDAVENTPSSALYQESQRMLGTQLAKTMEVDPEHVTVVNFEEHSNLTEDFKAMMEYVTELPDLDENIRLLAERAGALPRTDQNILDIS